jgi:hypothetical protein
VFFGSGEYRPGTYEGRRLLGHELTHTVQQRGTAAGPMSAYAIQRQPAATPPRPRRATR